MDLTEEKRGYLLVISAMLIWGSVGVLARYIQLTSMEIVFYRVLFAFVFLLIYTLNHGNFSFSQVKKRWPSALLVGIILALNWLFFFRAVKITSIASATLSYYTSPLILTVLSLLFLGEKINKKIIIALILGFSGLFLMMIGGLQLENVEFLGIIYGLMAAVFYALYTMSNKIFASLKAANAILLQTGAASLVFIPFIFTGSFPGFKDFLLLLIMGLVHTGFALILYIKGLRLIRAQEVGALSYLDPVSAIIFALIFLGEIPGLPTVFGGLLILIGSYFIVGKK
ncbi:MAG: DMT family transporter [Halanaerobiales bacterium]